MKNGPILSFKIEHQDGQARAGRLKIGQRCEVETPVFMPVGTRGGIKGLSLDEIEQMGYCLILANTYHLELRPGGDYIESMGGLHRLMRWNGGLLTDSGGFQVFSLAAMRKIDDDGVTFRSHLDGKLERMTPERAMLIQKQLGSDIVMAFDECPAFQASKEEVALAVRRTHAWAKKGLAVELAEHQARFGIIQGGMFEDLRQESIEQISSLPFEGLAFGGFSIGEPMETMVSVLEKVVPLTTCGRPRYLMGVGRPQDLIEAVRAGVDMFDCVLPARNGRNGQVFSFGGKFNIKRLEWSHNENPIDSSCPCFTCLRYSRAYLRHLWIQEDVLVGRLLSIHNLTFYGELMKKMREAITKNQFDDFSKSFYTQYHDATN